MSLQLENKYTKNEILQMYLNEAPYGGTAWGVGAAAEHAEWAQPISIRGLRILGVDDNAANRMILARMVEGFGCRVETVDSGPKALEALRAAQQQGDRLAELRIRVHDQHGAQVQAGQAGKRCNGC